MRAEIEINYLVSKCNKCDTQYQSVVEVPSDHWLTERVKIEAFQGYSRARNLGEYFRLRGATSWKGGSLITGLKKTSTVGAFYGDRKTKEGKTLIVFYRSEDFKHLKVCVFPLAYYPSMEIINQLIQENK